MESRLTKPKSKVEEENRQSDTEPGRGTRLSGSEARDWGIRGTLRGRAKDGTPQDGRLLPCPLSY